MFARLVGPFVLSLLLCAGMARAAEPDQATKAEARRLFEEGRDHHKVGRFEAAIEAYEKSYDLIPLPGVLFNIAQCHRNLKDDKRALFFFERYLAEAPDAADAEDVRKLVTELQAKIAKDEADAKARADSPPPPPPVVDLAPPPPPPPPAEESPPGLHEQWWFWVLVGAGAVAATVGVAAIATSSSPEGSIGTIDARIRF